MDVKKTAKVEGVRSEQNEMIVQSCRSTENKAEFANINESRLLEAQPVEEIVMISDEEEVAPNRNNPQTEAMNLTISGISTDFNFANQNGVHLQNVSDTNGFILNHLNAFTLNSFNEVLPSVYDGLECLEIISVSVNNPEIPQFPNYESKILLPLPFVTPQPALLRETSQTTSAENCSNLQPPMNNDSQDGDVVFVGQYKTTDLKMEENKDDDEQETSKKKTQSRRKRKIGSPRRKNPPRKAQTNIGTLLAESRAIPKSVFNAVVKKAGKKRDCLKTKNVRQSCRTSGAILHPPSPLKKINIREWPVSGMHEIPFYDPKTREMTKFHRDPLQNESTSNITKLEEMAKPICCKRCSFATHKNLHSVLSYVKDVQKFNKIIAERDGTEEMLPSYSIFKETYFDCGTSEETLKHSENIVQAACLLADACVLYILTNSCDKKLLSEYIANASEWLD